MVELGSGSGTSYPSGMDTNSTLEVDGSTLARAAVPNDLAAAIVAVETELGTLPKGTKADVKTFLQTEHNTNGTHGVITTTGGAVLDGSAYYGVDILKNGRFRVTQRGTSISSPANDAYTLDQWTCLVESAGTLTTIAQGTTSPASSSNSCDMTVNTNSKKFGIINFIENADSHKLHTSGKCSLSFYAKVSSAAANHLTDIRAVVLQWGSTADVVISSAVTTWGSSSAGITAYAANWTALNTPANLGVTSTLTKFKIENITTTGTANFAVLIWSDGAGSAQSGDVLYISDVCLNVGPVATESPFVPFQQEFALCQRFYWKSFPYATAPAQNCGSLVGALQSGNALTAGGYIEAFADFPVLMRVAPTITTFNPSAANANFRNAANTADVTVDFTGYSSERFCSIRGSTGSSTTDFTNFIHVTASAEL